MSHRAPSVFPLQQGPFPDITVGELSMILFDKLRDDPATREKALQILDAIEAEQARKAAAYICPTCRRPLGHSNSNHATNNGEHGR